MRRHTKKKADAEKDAAKKKALQEKLGKEHMLDIKRNQKKLEDFMAKQKKEFRTFFDGQAKETQDLLKKHKPGIEKVKKELKVKNDKKQRLLKKLRKGTEEADEILYEVHVY